MKSIVSVPVSFNASIKPKTQQEMKKKCTVYCITDKHQ